MSELIDLGSASTKELFRAYRSILDRLREKQVIRTRNAPTGDYAEYLVARALGGTLAPNSEKSFDLKVGGHRVQVKSRVVDGDHPDKPVPLSPFRSFRFDSACIVLFLPNFDIYRAVRLPRRRLEDRADDWGTHSSHVNGWIMRVTPAVLDDEAAEDITEVIRATAEQPSADPR